MPFLVPPQTLQDSEFRGFLVSRSGKAIARIFSQQEFGGTPTYSSMNLEDVPLVRVGVVVAQSAGSMILSHVVPALRTECIRSL